MVTEFQKEYLHYLYGRETYAYSPKERAYFICAYVDSKIIYVPVDILHVPNRVIRHFRGDEPSILSF
jgi:hypothetical protein